MRNLYAVLFLLLTSFFPMTAPAAAQSNLRQCPAVDLTGPADGAVLDPGYRINFTWDSEPRGTASREWVSVRVDLDDDSFSFDDAKRAKAEPRSYKGFARGRPGIYAWAVIFYDRNGNPICQSEARTYVVVGAGFASLSDTSSSAVKAALGRYIVKLAGSSYAGAFNREVAGDNYDDLADATGAFDWKAQGYAGLDVHGNDNDNVIRGSNQGDNIYGYRGNDTIRGRGGDDHIEGGNEVCVGLFCRAGDDVAGGDGNDKIVGGNEGCLAVVCEAGDTIRGGSGEDDIEGGDEGCLAVFCRSGDDIEAGGDADKVNGGNEVCIGFVCRAGDNIAGNGGGDTINGGNEACIGVVCGAGDILVGDGGKDTINGGNEGCGALGTCSAGDVISGGPGADEITGGTEGCAAFGGCNQADFIVPDPADNVTP